MAADWKKLVSSKRLRSSQSPPEIGDEGNDFLSDYYRIVFSSSFRRLQDKTQVSPLATNDFVRRRLTHSLEVATVGERMGRVLGRRIFESGDIPADHVGKIVANACLLHDIGNPPFGHEGENAIQTWCDENAPSFHDYRSFDGNAQGFRIATRLNHHGDFYGMNLTAATLACIVKYPIPAKSLSEPAGKVGKREKFGFFKSEKPIIDQVWQAVGLEEGHRHPLSLVMEAADDIVNRLVDLEDGIKLGLVSYDEVRQCVHDLAKSDVRVEKLLIALDDRRRSVLGASTGPSSRKNAEQLSFQHFRTVATTAFSKSAEEAFLKHIKLIEAGTFKGELIEHSNLAELYRGLRKIEYTNIFGDPSIVRIEAGGKRAIAGLLTCFNNAILEEGTKPKLSAPVSSPMTFPGEPPTDPEYERLQRVVDYVAGMTDHYAMMLYQQVTGASL